MVGGVKLMKNIRVLALMGVGGVVASFAAYRFAAPKAKGVIKEKSLEGFPPIDTDTNSDYLNFDFNSIFGVPGTAPKKENSPVRKPKGIANHNPLNIEAGRDKWQGMTGNDGRFIIFESVFWGIRAAARILKNYRDKRALNNVQSIVTRWAPPSDDNPTDKYIAFVANRAGVLATQPLSEADYPKVIAAMIHFENGYNPYDAQTISGATAEGFA
jgi:hypothetical protein